MLTQLSVTDYAAELASGKPAPGGGSAAALVGALGAALGEMVANFTVGRDKYAAAHVQVSAALERLTALRAELLALADADAHVYPQVQAAYRLPKDTEEQRVQRAGAIQDACKAAAEVPGEMVLRCCEALEQLPVLLEMGNPNLVSDVGVAARLALVGAQCAWLNVEINLKSLCDEPCAARLRSQMQENLRLAEKTSQQLWEATVGRICN